MIDDSDVDFFVLFANPKTWVGLLLMIIVAVGLIFIVSDNKDICAKKTCPAGLSGRLITHECLCVGEPVK